MSDSPAESLPLSIEAEKLCTAALYKAPHGSEPNTLQWVLAIAELFPDSLAPFFPEAQVPSLRQSIRESLKHGEGGPLLPKSDVVATASALAVQGGAKELSVAHMSKAIVEKAQPLLEELVSNQESSHPQTLDLDTDDEEEPSAEGPRPFSPAEVFAPSREVVIRRSERPSSSGRAPRADAKHPMLDRFAVDLTQAAKDGKLTPVVGRETEISLVLETLCKTTKRNPALVGQAGVGKTAIAEGVAMRIAAGDCPELLRNARIYLLQAASLVVGIQNPSEYAERVQQLIKEASDPDVILFVDEFHSVLERGMAFEQDLVTLLKPALARGEIACIAATTDDEYRRIVESDKALARRFQAIRIGEMSHNQTLQVLRAHGERIGAERKVAIPEEVLVRVLDLTADRMPNRRFPDKAVDVLEQAVAHAVIRHRDCVDVSDVADVVERLTGAPADTAASLDALAMALREERLLGPDEVEALIAKLTVAMEGLDIWPERPNAVILLYGPASALADRMSAVLARHLAGSEDRVVDMDFSFMTHPGDLSRLVGAGPSYIGYGEELPIHALIQYPWSVFLCRNVDLCYPSILTALINALRRGAIVDGMGRSIRLCDCVVLATVGDERSRSRSAPIGFVPRAPADDAETPVPDTIRPELQELCTIIVSRLAESSTVSESFIMERLLPDLAKRYRARGLEVDFDNSVAAWAAARFKSEQNEHILGDKLAAAIGRILKPYLPRSGTVHVRVEAVNSDLRVEAVR